MTTSLASARARSISLHAWRDAELDQLFATLDAGEAPTGTLRGRLFALVGTNWLPRTFNSLLFRLLALPINPWRGKHFDGAQGSNRWLALSGPSFGHYDCSIKTRDGHALHWLDYNVARNPAWLRGVRGEARQLQDGLWLCRMRWQSDAGLATLLWFTLEATDA